MSYFVYVLKCADDTLYVGSTNNLEKRLHQHNHAKNGAHYTKIRRPVVRVYEEGDMTYTLARSREAEIKRMSRQDKIKLIEQKMTKNIVSENIYKHEVVLLLDNVRSIQNVASLFRTGDCVGVSKIILGGITPGPLDRFDRVRNDFTKISLGAEKSVVWESVENIPKCIRVYAKKGYEIVALEQTKQSIQYTDFKITKPALIVVGTEVEGVSKSVLRLCTTHIEIPMHGKKESLNVAIATSVTLFQLRDN